MSLEKLVSWINDMYNFKVNFICDTEFVIISPNQFPVDILKMIIPEVLFNFLSLISIPFNKISFLNVDCLDSLNPFKSLTNPVGITSITIQYLRVIGIPNFSKKSVYVSKCDPGPQNQS